MNDKENTIYQGTSCEISSKIIQHSKQGAQQTPSVSIQQIVQAKQEQAKNNKE